MYAVTAVGCVQAEKMAAMELCSKLHHADLLSSLYIADKPAAAREWQPVEYVSVGATERFYPSTEGGNAARPACTAFSCSTEPSVGRAGRVVQRRSKDGAAAVLPAA